MPAKASESASEGSAGTSAPVSVVCNHLLVSSITSTKAAPKARVTHASAAAALPVALIDLDPCFFSSMMLLNLRFASAVMLEGWEAVGVDERVRHRAGDEVVAVAANRLRDAAWSDMLAGAIESWWVRTPC